MGGGKLNGAFEGTQGDREFKEKISPKGQKPKDDVQSWAKGERPFKGESGKEFAERVMDKVFGKGNYKKRGRDFSKLKKYADSHFR